MYGNPDKSFWPCGSIVANPIIYRLVPSPSRYEIRQFQMLIDLESLLMSIFRRGLFLDEPLLFISSGREELYWNYFVSYYTKLFPTKLFRFLRFLRFRSSLRSWRDARVGERRQSHYIPRPYFTSSQPKQKHSRAKSRQPRRLFS